MAGHLLALREKDLTQDTKICTNCAYGNGTAPTTCVCENPPFSVPAKYNEECGMGKECAEGEGICYRPCMTFLHVTSCPVDYCQWNRLTLICEDRSMDMPTVYWRDTSVGSDGRKACRK
ncbi:unnamed protein product [Effrenium voratum]|uniref:Uncharacterized protein n=1 Tax=Effrenium voratum TaxID=2562239 RepID=A0AA36N025_9DINO|nr:unnamed protein product [Effrenium voratum]CAJ1453134.1 unnamed protein product [Effrenium voratum]